MRLLTFRGHESWVQQEEEQRLKRWRGVSALRLCSTPAPQNTAATFPALTAPLWIPARAVPDHADDITGCQTHWAARPVPAYLGVRDGQAVHRLRRLEQLDLLDHVGLRTENHHPLQPALSCGAQKSRSGKVISEATPGHSIHGLLLNTRLLDSVQLEQLQLLSH